MMKKQRLVFMILFAFNAVLASYELKNELKELLRKKTCDEKDLVEFKEYCLLSNCIKRRLDFCYNNSVCLCLFPITIPMYVIDGIEHWYTWKEYNEELIKKYENDLQILDEKIKKTEEKINLFENSIENNKRQ